jgi:hypothetical protein
MQCNAFESLVGNQPYVWSSIPISGYKPVAAGRVSGKPVTFCRATVASPGFSWLEVGYTADGSTCTVFMPTTDSEVRAITQPFDLLYAPSCSA